MGPIARLIGVAVALCCSANLWGDYPQLAVSPNQYIFNATPGSTSTLARVGEIINVTHNEMSWKAAVDAPWLAVAPANGFIVGLDRGERQKFTLLVNPSGLKEGIYSAKITFTGTGISLVVDSPQTVPVILTVSSGPPPPLVGISVNNLNWDGVAQVGVAQTAAVNLTNLGGQTLQWNAVAMMDQGAGWLTVSPASGSGNSGSITIRANPAVLSAGIYSGRIVVRSATSDSQATVYVTYSLRAPTPPYLRLSGTNISLQGASAGGKGMVQGNLSLSNDGEAPLRWKASGITFNGGPWLTVSPDSGVAPSEITIRGRIDDLAPGTYIGKLTFTADATSNTPVDLFVSLVIPNLKPVIWDGGILNTASGLPGPISPGMLTTLAGDRLGPAQGFSTVPDAGTGRYPTSARGTRVLFDGVPAPLFYVAADTISLQAPFEIAATLTTRVRIESIGYDALEMDVPVVAANLSAFTKDGTFALAFNGDGSSNDEDHPAQAGTTVQFLLTGQGSVDMDLPTGAAPTGDGPAPRPILPMTATLDGLPATIVDAGLAPGHPGILQIQIQVPTELKFADGVPRRVKVVFQEGDAPPSPPVDLEVAPPPVQ